MFVDSSVLVAMMIDEEEARLFADRLQISPARMTSPIAAAEAAVAVAARLGMTAVDAGQAVRTFLQLMNIQLLAVPPRAASMAAEAYDRFGEDRHPAQLTLANCMSYACARYYRQSLLYKGEGFGLTDIEKA